MVIGFVSIKCDIMPPHFFIQDIRGNAAAHTDVLDTVVKPLITAVGCGFQQDSAPWHRYHNTQEWWVITFHYYVTHNLWSPRSPHVDPLGYYIWIVDEKDSNK